MTNMERIDYMLKSKEELIDIIDQYKDDMQRLKDGYYEFKIRNRSLESVNDKLKKENEMLKIKNAYPICPIFEGNIKEAANNIFGVNGTIYKLREENKKLKEALEFCQKEASSARSHAHNVEVNAERIRLGID